MSFLDPPSPIKITAPIITRQISARLLDHLATIPNNSPLFGPIGAGIQMPRSEPDGRKLSWQKLTGTTVSSITLFNRTLLMLLEIPKNMLKLYREIGEVPALEGCWFYPAGTKDTNGYPQAISCPRTGQPISKCSIEFYSPFGI